MIISSPRKGTAFNLETSTPKNDCNELLLTKSHEDKVGLGFFILNKEIQRTQAEIDAIKNDGDYDEEGAVLAEGPYYIAVKIGVQDCLFNIRSDDFYKEESAFVDLKPEVALAHAAQIREEKDKK